MSWIIDINKSINFLLLSCLIVESNLILVWYYNKCNYKNMLMIGIYCDVIFCGWFSGEDYNKMRYIYRGYLLMWGY